VSMSIGFYSFRTGSNDRRLPLDNKNVPHSDAITVNCSRKDLRHEGNPTITEPQILHILTQKMFHINSVQFLSS
jgi:hypothetical protein